VGNAILWEEMGDFGPRNKEGEALFPSSSLTRIQTLSSLGDALTSAPRKSSIAEICGNLRNGFTELVISLLASWARTSRGGRHKNYTEKQ
jgi:hypothetical protein